MTKHEAFQLLKCNYLDEVQDAYEDALFEFKSKFLQQIPPLKLIEAIKKKIIRVNAAYELFYPYFEKDEIENKKNEVNDLSLFLEKHQFRLSQLRLAITNSIKGWDLLNWITELADHQSNLFIKLSSYLVDKQSNLDAYPIKLSDEIDVFKLQLELKALQLDHTKISEYIRTQINDLDFEEFAYITQVVISAEKQIIFNELRREIY
jgi:hypothetical protein